MVIPTETKSYLGKIKAPALNSGKIKIGQNVNIRLSNYPDREFGMLNGVIKTISLTPDKDNNLLIDVELPKGLKTSYKQVNCFSTGNVRNSRYNYRRFTAYRTDFISVQGYFQEKLIPKKHKKVFFDHITCYTISDFVNSLKIVSKFLFLWLSCNILSPLS